MTKLRTKDIQAGVIIIQGNQARLVSKVVDDVVTYCKFLVDSGEPWGSPPGACKIKSMLVWADRIASPAEVARYDQQAILAASRSASEKWLTRILALTPTENLLAELESRGVKAQ
jgi:hypothetical protein